MKCLYCHKEILSSGQSAESEFHPGCSRKFFGSVIPPRIDFSLEDVEKLAKDLLSVQKTVAGVQPKLSLSRQKTRGKYVNDRLTLVGLFGDYILKPQTETYPQLPEIEDCCMHLAEEWGISVVPHSLVRLSSGEAAYITRRIDRESGRKIHMEDMCQVTEKLTEQKYKGSHEQIVKAIRKYSIYPGLDAVNFYEMVLFSFLSGNNDMHLKNFSLIRKPAGYHLSPAYDLIASALVVEEDTEELALTLNGKKRNIHYNDFMIAMERGGIPQKAAINLMDKYREFSRKCETIIRNSFMTAAFQEKLIDLTARRSSQIYR